MRNLFLVAVLVFACNPSFAGPGVGTGNGGDGIKLEFASITQVLLKHIDEIQALQTAHVDTAALKKAMTSTQIQTQEQTFLNGVEVDAINYPDVPEIVLSCWRWFQKFDIADKTALALHEYLSIARIDDTNYRVSGPALTELRNKSWLPVDFPLPIRQIYCVEDSKMKQANEGSVVIDLTPSTTDPNELIGTGVITTPDGVIQIHADVKRPNVGWIISMSLDFGLIKNGSYLWRGGSNAFSDESQNQDLRMWLLLTKIPITIRANTH